MENKELYINDEVMGNSFDSEYEVNMEMDEVNPWMIIASETGKTVA